MDKPAGAMQQRRPPQDPAHGDRCWRCWPSAFYVGFHRIMAVALTVDNYRSTRQPRQTAR
ncbi:MAG: hypothetical protein MZV65_41340 [Chromatiales bacterium]|nr:hypothetical protein [Chromatiales bacterium]